MRPSTIFPRRPTLLLQAAAHLANMGVASMLLGSPPPAQVAMAPPVMSPVHLPPSYMAPPPAVMSPQLVPSPHDFGMLQAAAAAGMMGQAGVMGAGYDAGYGLGGELHMAMPMHAMGPAHSTPPPRFGGRPGPGGYAARQGSGGYRGTPGGNRMSRFAPTSDAVAAF